MGRTPHRILLLAIFSRSLKCLILVPTIKGLARLSFFLEGRVGQVNVSGYIYTLRLQGSMVYALCSLLPDA